MARPVDPAYVAFLSDRLDEELTAATDRASTTATSVELLRTLLADARRGVAPDPMSLRLLTYAYAKHPGFRPEWSPWAP